MARVKLRSRREVVERCRVLSGEVAAALARASADLDDVGAVATVWSAEGLGMLLWALELAQLPPYDRPFRPERLLEAPLDDGDLRPEEEIERARETARLWHWRARTAALQAGGDAELPGQWQSFDQLVGATAMRAHEQGFLPRPLRGDFPAFGTVYRELDEAQQAEAHRISWERHRALNWLCGLGRQWDDVPTDT
jgi:hypothetical protein